MKSNSELKNKRTFVECRSREASSFYLFRLAFGNVQVYFGGGARDVRLGGGGFVDLMGLDRCRSRGFEANDELCE